MLQGLSQKNCGTENHNSVLLGGDDDSTEVFATPPRDCHPFYFFILTLKYNDMRKFWVHYNAILPHSNGESVPQVDTVEITGLANYTTIKKAVEDIWEEEGIVGKTIVVLSWSLIEE